MRILVLLGADGRVTGATQAVHDVGRVGRPSAWLTDGPDQRVVEVDVPDEMVPDAQAEPSAVSRFLDELAARVRKASPDRS
jgi:hypothetical protein